MGMLLVVACTSKSPSGQITLMQQRVTVVEQKLETLYNQDFNTLVKAYEELDTTVARTKDLRYEMELLQAYLQQFENERVVMQSEIKFSKKQLSDLQDDVKNHQIDEKMTSQYIQDEEKALHTLEAQIKYFQEKFNQQKEVVKQLRKE